MTATARSHGGSRAQAFGISKTERSLMKLRLLVALLAILVPLTAYADLPPYDPPTSMYATLVRSCLHGLVGTDPGSPFEIATAREPTWELLIPVATVLAFIIAFAIWLWRRWEIQTGPIDESEER